MTVLLLIIWALALMRVTRLINADAITNKLRLYPAGKLREATLRKHEAITAGWDTNAEHADRSQRRWATVLEFVQCPWCVGMWAALLSSPLPVWVLGWPWWSFLPLALAASHLIGVCARFADTEEIEIVDAEDE